MTSGQAGGTGWDDAPPFLLEPVTGVAASAFAALPAVGQGAVVARVGAEQVRMLDVEAAEAVVAVTQQAINALAGLRDVAIAACVQGEERRSAALAEELTSRATHRPDALEIVASSL